MEHRKEDTNTVIIGHALTRTREKCARDYFLLRNFMIQLPFAFYGQAIYAFALA